MKIKKFRIRDFKSIVDSGDCCLSEDGITVLAGQNEAGKTSVLSALNEFSVAPGESTLTDEYFPEGRFDAKPTVSIGFEIQEDELNRIIQTENVNLPGGTLEMLNQTNLIWVHKELEDGIYSLDKEVEEKWIEELEQLEQQQIEQERLEQAQQQQTADDKGEKPEDPADLEEVEPEEEEEEHDESDNEEEEQDETGHGLEPRKFVDSLYNYWPSIVYFDSFQDCLPKEIDISVIIPDKEEHWKGVGEDTPQPVKDFIELSDMDVSQLIQLESHEKALRNYLQTRGAIVTGDFLSFWKQTVDGFASIRLQVRSIQNSDETPKLGFYIRDNDIDLYPEQRSKGFLWFLSFYLKLAAEHKRNPQKEKVLLIDEPGSYLHARAQHDLLHLLEDRISRSQQVIYSTHSPYLLPAEKLHRMKIVLNNSQQGTKVLNRLSHPMLSQEEFSDTLSTINAAIGLDIRNEMFTKKEKNLLVERMSDRLYLLAWLRKFRQPLTKDINIFPGTESTSLSIMASLFIGWGLKFAALLDNDTTSERLKEMLLNKLGIMESQIVQLKHVVTLEDLFTKTDFRRIVALMDPNLKMNAYESPSTAIERLKINRVILGKIYLANAEKIELSKTTEISINRCLDALLSDSTYSTT